MKRKTKIISTALALMLAFPLFSCSENATLPPSNELESVLPEQNLPPESSPPVENGGSDTQTPPVEEQTPTPAPTPTPQPPKQETASYIRCTGDNVNLRAGAGTSFTAIGQAEKGTTYAVLGKTGNWYKVNYQNKTAYLYSEYGAIFTLEKSDNEKVEKVIEEGYKLLGVPYVYGAVRLHDGKGNFLKGFTVNKFDCSSLVQYAFYKGANVLLDVTTRTQVVQGKYVKKSELKRGDCIYFTNESRQYKTGVERIGQVAIYLGNDYILHTASDYARIEKMSATRHKFYVESRRFV
jgi:cell wall-associated NlpC family hydrolase